MLIIKKFTLLVFFFLLVCEKSFAVEEKKNIIINQIFNEKTHAGPMGMGLTKSYEINNQKICIYNTINGQEKITFKNLSKCPVDKPLKKIYKK